MKSIFPADIWIAWIAATIVAALTLSSFVFGKFETKDDALDKRNQLELRLDRIEGKIDSLIEKK